MPPYRSPAPRNDTVSFGNDRHRALLAIAALLLIGASLATVVAWLVFGGRIHGSVLTPALAGLFILFRRRGGSIAYLRDEQQLCVTWRTVLRDRRARIPLHDVAGLTILPFSWKDRNPEFGLRLVLTGERSLLLLRGSDAARLEPARAAVSAFLLEHRLLSGEAGDASNVRVQVDADASAVEPEPPEASRRTSDGR